MSVKAMAAVWEMDMSPEEKYVLLCYADHADHDGGSIYPAVAKIAKKTGYSERTVQRITRQLETNGRLVQDGSGPRGTNRWRMTMDGGDKMSPPISGDDTVVTGGVTSTTERGDIAMSPEPSLTIIKPSLTTTTRENSGEVFSGDIFKAYESEIGIITPRVRDAIGDYLDDLRIPSGWILDAIHIAAEQNKRNWAYCAAILKRWAVEGKTALPMKQKPSDLKYPNKTGDRSEFLKQLAEA